MNRQTLSHTSWKRFSPVLKNAFDFHEPDSSALSSLHVAPPLDPPCGSWRGRAGPVVPVQGTVRVGVAPVDAGPREVEV